MEDQNKAKADQQDFVKMLSIYAAIQPYRAPDFSNQGVAWYWYQEFKFRSIEDLKSALDYHIKRNDHFPSLRELTNALLGRVDDDTLSKITAMNILGAISKYGWPNWPEAKVYIGELGERIVTRFGGWPVVCEMLRDDNHTYLQNYFKEAGKSILSVYGHENEFKALPNGSKVSDIVKQLSEATDIKAKEYNKDLIKLQSCDFAPKLPGSNELVSEVEEFPW